MDHNKYFMNHHIMILSDTYRVYLQERGFALCLQQPRPELAVSLLQKVAHILWPNSFLNLLHTEKQIQS